MADRTTSTVLESVTNTGSVARTTATQADVLLDTGPSVGRVTSTVLEALISIASHGPGWVCAIG